jgi:dihydroflavonol-4-reductase
VARVIHTSSAATIGERQGTTGTETSPHRGHFLSEYERSKSEAERLALGSHRDVEVVSVNPSSVQGPGRATGTGALLLAAAKGRIPFLVDAVFSLVDIDDCARGHQLAAEHGLPGERYVVSGAIVTVREVVRMMRRRQGRTRAPWFVEPRVVEALAPVVDAGCRAIGKESPLCPESARVLLHGHRYDGSRATRDLGLEYTPLEATLARTLDWFEAESLL